MRVPRSGDWGPEWSHAFFQNCLRKLICSAEDERAEVLIPIARRRNRTRLHPFLEGN